MNEHPVLQEDKLSIRIARHFETFVEDQVAGGRYPSASAVVEEGLRLLERRESKLASLREALIEGEESGEPTPLDMEEIIRSERQAAGLSPRDA